MRLPFLVAALGALSCFVCSPSTARAQAYRDGPPPELRLVYRDLNVVRLNPLGLISDGRLTLRKRLYESESLALRDNFVSVGVAPVLSGAFVRMGALVEVQPLSILQLWALYEWVGYFGMFNFLQSFSDATAPYSDTVLRERAARPENDPLRNYATTGTQLVLGATLQIKVKDVVVRTQAKVQRPDFDLRAGDRVFYDIFNDLLVGNRAWHAVNDFDVLYQHPSGLTAGLRWAYAQGFYGEEHFAEDADRTKAPGALHRVGPLVAYTWKKPDGSGFEDTLLAVVNWWVSSPNRAGQDVSQAMPYLLVGYAMNGDLLGK
jgi:hypothetical protein